MRWIIILGLTLFGAACNTTDDPEHCSVDGCHEGFHCATQTDRCEADCEIGSCAVGHCDVATGRCELFVAFECPNFEACVREHVGIPEGGITAESLAGIERLVCTDRGITSIEGAQYMTALNKVDLFENELTNLFALRDATGLTELQVGSNRVTDASLIFTFTSLEVLSLFNNGLEDISGISSLMELKYLNLDSNNITSLAPLAALENLTWLTCENNPVNDYRTADTLRTAGTDVYAGFDATKARLDAFPGVGSEEALSQGTSLCYDVDRVGEVHIFSGCPLDKEPVTRLFDGTLKVYNDLIYFHSRHGVFPVGTLVNNSLSLCSGRFSDLCRFSVGSMGGGGRPAGFAGDSIHTASLVLNTGRENKSWPPREDSHFVLEPFIYAAPNQYDAGSCVFMANTGAMEMLLNQHAPSESYAYEGETDLSERYLMNVYQMTPDPPSRYFITDLPYTYNHNGGSLLNSQYHFSLGYVKEDAQGNRIQAEPDDPDAYLSAYVNWFDDLPEGWQGVLTSTPAIDRTIIFHDPVLTQNSIWNVGLMSDDVIDRIKYELRTKNAPVILVYNHFLYWHATVIVGYDDAMEFTSDCPMVTSSVEYFRQQSADAYADKIETRMAEQGGCSLRGGFYVRDSIYEGTREEPMYQYSANPLVVDNYSQRIVTHSYNWAKYLGNHAYTVHRR
ncbi:leucine-rich repeat domain-containing protein [Myxococcota bacterium]|nr:leucine-rich repeat domain-containing protein [Myxococcota bacterium]MBU1537634.1 leucine-rich repeat domain-containing protein [Myxococcota bacterium]